MWATAVDAESYASFHPSRRYALTRWPEDIGQAGKRPDWRTALPSCPAPLFRHPRACPEGPDPRCSTAKSRRLDPRHKGEDDGRSQRISGHKRCSKQPFSGTSPRLSRLSSVPCHPVFVSSHWRARLACDLASGGSGCSGSGGITPLAPGADMVRVREGRGGYSAGPGRMLAASPARRRLRT